MEKPEPKTGINPSQLRESGVEFLNSKMEDETITNTIASWFGYCTNYLLGKILHYGVKSFNVVIKWCFHDFIFSFWFTEFKSLNNNNILSISQRYGLGNV